MGKWKNYGKPKFLMEKNFKNKWKITILNGRMEKSLFLWENHKSCWENGKLTIAMAVFNGFVELPEGSLSNKNPSN